MMEWITTYWFDMNILSGGSGLQVNMGLPTCVLLGTLVLIKVYSFLPKKKGS